MKLSNDLREFVELLNTHNVDFLVVGGYAVAFHGYPRYTGDIDILVRSTLEQSQWLVNALNEFGFGSLGFTEDTFMVPNQIVQLGRPPNRIDLLTSISGVEFEEAWASRVVQDLDGVPVSFLAKELLVKNKIATGRTKDLADVEKLQ